MFDDTPLLRRRLKGVSAVVANGIRYKILTVDDSDPGYIMLTLDTEDAAVLRGVEMEFVSFKECAWTVPHRFVWIST